MAEDQVVAILKDIKAGVKPRRETIYHTICNPPDAKSNRKMPTEQHLVDEAIGLTAAATETVGNAMDTAVWAAVHNPQIYARLHNELKKAFPNPDHMPFTELEKLPYLSAVIKEALRSVFYDNISKVDAYVLNKLTGVGMQESELFLVLCLRTEPL